MKLIFIQIYNGSNKVFLKLNYIYDVNACLFLRKMYLKVSLKIDDCIWLKGIATDMQMFIISKVTSICE